MLHFRFSHQHDAMQCGASCLCMAGSFYGRKYSLRTVSKMCGVKNNGVSLLGIAEAAKKMGLASIACRMSLDMLKQQNIPCIIHWNGNHFVFLYKIDGEKVYIADPAKGCVKYHIGYDDTGYSDCTYTAWADPEEKKEYKELKNFNDKMSSFKLFFAKTGTYTTEGASK